MPDQNNGPSGFLLMSKPPGITSFDVVRQLRRLLGIKRLGHSGVLDKPAQGLLVVGVNKATRLFELFASFTKEYEADFWFGLRTNTDDLSGELLAQREPGELTADVLEAALARYRGVISQVPPQFSLAKVGGKEMYRHALAGAELRPNAREVTVSASRLLEFAPAVPWAVALSDYPSASRLSGLPESATLARARVWVECKGGVYIRALARDIGVELGCGGSMGRLLRTRIGPFRLRDAVMLEELEARLAGGVPVEHLLLPISAVAAELHSVTLSTEQAVELRHGRSLATTRLQEINPELSNGTNVICCLAESGALIAIAQELPAEHIGLRVLKPLKVFL